MSCRLYNPNRVVIFLAIEKKKMTKTEIEQWDSLYEYVRTEIMTYDSNQALSQQMVLKLKGLATGKAVENRKIADRADYSYDVILKTFQICKQQITNSIRGKTFKSELTKLIYASKIVENNINDVYVRLQNVERSKERIECKNTENLSHRGANYVPKNTDVSHRLEELW